MQVSQQSLPPLLLTAGWHTMWMPTKTSTKLRRLVSQRCPSWLTTAWARILDPSRLHFWCRLAIFSHRFNSHYHALPCLEANSSALIKSLAPHLLVCILHQRQY